MKTIIVLLLSITLFSCNQKSYNKIQSSQKKGRIQINTTNEKFKTIDSDKLNQLLKGKSEDLSAQDVMKLYYPSKVESGEGNERIEISEKKLENGNTSVTLIHDNLRDDSQRGEKYIMELKRANNKWAVISIKKNWKCWNGRGHTDWGIEMCN